MDAFENHVAHCRLCASKPMELCAIGLCLLRRAYEGCVVARWWW